MHSGQKGPHTRSPLNTHMKLLSTLIALVLLHLMITPANSGHSRGNNTCEDDKLQRFLCDGGDPFTSLASDWLSIPMQSVTETERAKAKQCVYGKFAVARKQQGA